MTLRLGRDEFPPLLFFTCYLAPCTPLMHCLSTDLFYLKMGHSAVLLWSYFACGLLLLFLHHHVQMM